MFNSGFKYDKRNIYKLLGVPQTKQRGEWDKGYRVYEGNVFIFSNIGIPGRTGHKYNNYWDGDLFVWEATKTSHIGQSQIQRMISPLPGQKNFLFTRTDDRSPFVFEGNMIVKEYIDSSPVKIIWAFEHYPYNSLREEVARNNNDNTLYEGALSKIYVNKYERNPLARRVCLSIHGTRCYVCSFDFQKEYGEIGKGYIHVHHIIPLATIGKEYILVPETDLIPVCPNCHAMLHSKKIALLPEELKRIVNQSRLTK